MRAIVVEDIDEMREGLIRSLGSDCPDIEVVGSANSVVSAVKLIKEAKPALLFLDIELPDGNGFDILDIIDERPKVIFTTASDSYAVTAFKYSAIDYLLKPYTREELVSAVDKVKNSDPVSEEQSEILLASMNGHAPEKIALHTSDRITFVEVKDIVRCSADGNYTRFYVKGKSVILVARTLKEYDKMLAGGTFFRVHQSHLVNKQEVREFVKVDGGYLVLSDGSKVPVSTRRRQAVLEWLEGNNN